MVTLVNICDISEAAEFTALCPVISLLSVNMVQVYVVPVGTISIPAVAGVTVNAVPEQIELGVTSAITGV